MATTKNDFPKEVIIVQERSKNKPLTNYAKLKSEQAMTRAVGQLALDDFIGRSYKLEHYPFESTQNIGFPVIDIEKYLADYPDYYQSVPMKESNSWSESFNGIERYETKMQKTKTVSTGLEIDFKIFKVGSKKVIRKFSNVASLNLNKMFSESCT